MFMGAKSYAARSGISDTGLSRAAGSLAQCNLTCLLSGARPVGDARIFLKGALPFSWLFSFEMMFGFVLHFRCKLPNAHIDISTPT